MIGALRWPWRRKKKPLLCSEPGCNKPVDEHFIQQINVGVEPGLWGKSPFDKDVLRPGDPGWEIFELAMKTGGPVMAVYNNETGEVVSMEAIKDDDPHIGNGRAETPEDIPEQPDRFER